MASYRDALRLAAKGLLCRPITPSHDSQVFRDVDCLGSGQFSSGPPADVAHQTSEDRQPSPVSATGNRIDSDPVRNPLPERLPEQVAPAGVSRPAAQAQQLQPSMQGMSLGPGASANHGALPASSPTSSLQDSAAQVRNYCHYDKKLLIWELRTCMSNRAPIASYHHTF